MNAKKSNLFFLCIMILLILGSLFIPLLLRSYKIPSNYWTSILEFLVLLIPSIIYILISKKSFKETLSLKPINIKTLAIVILIGFISQPLMMFLGAVSQLFFHNYVTDAMKQMQGLNYFVLLGLISVTPAICEETVMRGVVLSGYRNIDIKKAALMNGLLFGLFHLGAQQFLYAFALGFIFVYLVEATGSILASALCHFTVNGIQITLSWAMYKLAVIKNQNFQNVNIPKQSIIVSIIFLFMIAAVFTPIIYILIKELDYTNGGRLALRSQSIVDKTEKVINWPIFAIIALYILVLIFFR